MSTLTAEEWNERYPVGTCVQVWKYMDRRDEPELSHTRSQAWPLGDGTPIVHTYLRASVPLQCIERAPVDDHRLAGWLPPDEAERLKLEVAKLDAHAARRGYEDSVRSRIFGSTARERDWYESEVERLGAALKHAQANAEVLADEVVHAHAQLAAVQPVIDAARAERATFRALAAVFESGDDPTEVVARHSAAVDATGAAVDAFEAALDGGSPEGLKQ